MIAGRIVAPIRMGTVPASPQRCASWGGWSGKGECRKGLARAFLVQRFGEIRHRTHENQQHRLSGLNLLVTAIILWNTRYLKHAFAALHQTEAVPEDLLTHSSPLGWEHINLNGGSIWGTGQTMSENTNGLRPLRGIPGTMLQAA